MKKESPRTIYWNTKVYSPKLLLFKENPFEEEIDSIEPDFWFFSAENRTKIIYLIFQK